MRSAPVTLDVSDIDENPRGFILPLGDLVTFLRCIRRDYPRETCGLLLCRIDTRPQVIRYVATPGGENTKRSFVIRGDVVWRVSRSAATRGEVVCGCAHSHTRGPALPSHGDHRKPSEMMRLWLIYSVRYHKLNLFVYENQRFRRVPIRLS